MFSLWQLTHRKSTHHLTSLSKYNTAFKKKNWFSVQFNKLYWSVAGQIKILVNRSRRTQTAEEDPFTVPCCSKIFWGRIGDSISTSNRDIVRGTVFRCQCLARETHTSVTGTFVSRSSSLLGLDWLEWTAGIRIYLHLCNTYFGLDVSTVKTVCTNLHVTPL